MLSFSETAFTSFKQRILTYFYMEAVENDCVSDFYAQYNNYANLKMFRMQLLDERYLLIKMVASEHLTNPRLNRDAIAAVHAATASVVIAAATNNINNKNDVE
jgi:hypothetical protein